MFLSSVSIALAFVSSAYTSALPPPTTEAYGDVDFKVYEDTGCETAFGAYCDALLENVCCDTSFGGTRAWGAGVFLWADDTMPRHVKGDVNSLQNGNPCAVTVVGGLLEGTCGIGIHDSITGGGYVWNYVGGRAKDITCTSTVKAGLFVREGETTWHLNSTNSQHHEAVFALNRSGKKEEAKQYLRANSDFVKQEKVTITGTKMASYP